MKKRTGMILTAITAIWICVIIWFTLQTGDESSQTSGRIAALLIKLLSIDDPGKLELVIRKLAHFSEYAVLGFLSFLTVKKLKVKTWFSILSVVLVACCDEFIQSFVPGRGPSPVDVMIDCSGGALAICILTVLTFCRHKHTHLSQ